MKPSCLLVVSACLGAAIALPSSARAQGPPVESQRMISIGLGGGVSVPVSDASDAFKSGANGQGFLRLNLHGLPIRPRVDFTFQHFDLKHAAVAGPQVPNGTGSLIAGAANLQVALMRGTIEPYLVAGLGAYDLKTEVNETSTSKTQFGVNGGAGLLVHLRSLSLYAEGRLDNVFTDKGVIDTKSVQVVPVTFGIVY